MRPDKLRLLKGGRSTYQVAPDLSADDFAALKADIAARGVLVPVEYDDAGNVLDGHHRLKACRELGITDWPRLVRTGLSEQQKRHHARQLNLARRHLNPGQRRLLIAEQLKDTPERSNRQIAEGLVVDYKVVQTVRSELERREEIPHVSKLLDKSGRYQPATRPPRVTDLEEAPKSDTVDGQALVEQPGHKRATRKPPKKETTAPRFEPDPEFQAEAEAAERELEYERQERIALAGTGDLVEENARLTKQISALDRRLSRLINELGACKYREQMWKQRAIEAGWKSRPDA